MQPNCHYSLYLIPLFIKKPNGGIEILSSFSKEIEIENFEGHKLAYLGKPIDAEEVTGNNTAMEDVDGDM